MRLFGQFAIILCFSYAGHLLANGLSVPLPSSVIGLVLLVAALRLRLLPEKWIADTAHFLSANMAFFFLPLSVEIVENYDHVKDVFAKLMFIAIVSTVVTFAASYSATRFLQRLMAKRSHNK